MEYKFSVIVKNVNDQVRDTDGIVGVVEAQGILRKLIKTYPSDKYEIFIEASINVLEHARVDNEDPEKQMIEMANRLLKRISNEPR